MSAPNGSSKTRINDPNAVRDVIPDAGLRPMLARSLGAARGWLGGNRFDGVTVALADAIRGLPGDTAQQRSLLDFGCGNMAVSGRLQEIGLVTSVRGVDTYPPPEQGGDKFDRYTQLPPGSVLPFETGAFDVAITVDVLHHIGVEDTISYLRELARVSKYVIVKDHFEYGPVTRQLLRLADWYGNYAYGVNVPDRYYDPPFWKDVVRASGLRELSLTCPVRIHRGLFGIILPARCHYVSVLTTDENA